MMPKVPTKSIFWRDPSPALQTSITAIKINFLSLSYFLLQQQHIPMPPIPEPDASATGGVYDVNESGIQFRHMPSLPTPANGDEFLKRIKSGFQFNVLERPSKNELVFEIIGVDVSFANALRRIMIAEIPTMALEHVYMWNNTGLIHDEVLSHRLGLVPLNVDPRLFDEYGHDLDEDGELAFTDRNTIVFRMNVVCGKSEVDDERIQKKRNAQSKAEGLISGYDVEEAQQKKKEKDAKKKKVGGDDDDEMKEEVEEPSVMNLSIADRAAADAATSNLNQSSTPIDTPHRPFTKHIYTRDLLWCPQGDQLSRFPLHSSGVGSGVGGGIRPLHEDILLAKLRPGQVIELEAHARKGIGKDHAKWSPVATASYRLMPSIEVVKPIYDELAEELVNWMEPGVFKLEETDEAGHRVKAVVVNPYACTMSRNFMRNPVLKESIKMSRIPNHFIFSVESVGMMEPAIIVAEALKVLKNKAINLTALVDEAEAMNE
jgi:DNA-directed RNA polymerase I and III subunit RPAC1